MSNIEEQRPGRALWIGLLVFVLALGLRILFLEATPDATGPYSPYYKGDTPVWLEYARAIRSSGTFDLGLPLRPPGVAYLVASVWNGQENGFWTLRLAWSFLGAATIALFFLAVLRSFDPRVATVAAFMAAVSTGLMILSTAPNNETPYLLLVITSFTLWEPIRQRPRLLTLLAWSALHGLACLIRVEHLLFFALVSVYLAWVWARVPGAQGTWRQSLGRVLVMLILFTLPLIPWHLHTWSQIEQFNQQPLDLNAATENAYSRLERGLEGLRWSEGAMREVERLPAFNRRAMTNFVAATVVTRGGVEVTGEDFRIIEEAFGSRPEAIAAHPFVSVYGGLNFYLANNPLASGGFSRAAMDAPPPLTGGPSRYPGFLINGLPPPELSLSYPPHLEALNHGYGLGWEWIRKHPGEYLSLVRIKLGIFWAGMTQGFTGYNLPLGMSGKRGVVDMVIPEGGIGISLWRWAGFAMLLLALWTGRREPGLVPWLLLAATKVTTTVAFYGYAREGAVLIPVYALLLSLLVIRGLPRYTWYPMRFTTTPDVRKVLRVSCMLAVFLIVIEGYRWVSKPVLLLDGKQVGVVVPYPATDYLERHLQVTEASN